MLSAEARLRAAILLRDGVREERRKSRLNGRAEPGWCGELDAFAASLFYEDDVTQVERRRKRALNRDAARRYRQRNREGAA